MTPQASKYYCKFATLPTLLTPLTNADF